MKETSFTTRQNLMVASRKALDGKRMRDIRWWAKTKLEYGVAKTYEWYVKKISCRNKLLKHEKILKCPKTACLSDFLLLSYLL